MSHLKRMPILFAGTNGPSYGEPSSSTKGKASIIIDYLYLFFVRGMLPRNYHLWGFDAKPRRVFKDYMDEPDSPFLRRRLYTTIWDDGYSTLVNDKFLFHCYCQCYQLPTPLLYGVLQDGRFFSSTPENARLLPQLDKETTLVVKPVRGTQGAGICFMPAAKLSPAFQGDGSIAADSLTNAISHGEFVVEAYIRQHPEMQRINPYSVNTIRVITLLTRHQEVVPLAGILRTSFSKRGTDNFSTGGIVIGIDLAVGKLNRWGYVKSEYGTILDAHPLTHIRFENFQIPFWPQVLDLIDNAQRRFHHLSSIGWDIAISETGPVLIEGNIEWGTAGIQAATGGLLTQKNRALFAEYNLHFK